MLIGEQGFEFMEFARKTCMLLRDRLKMYERSDPEYAELHDKLTRYQTIAQCDPKTWVWEESNNSVNFTPIYPGRYAYQLWSRVRACRAAFRYSPSIYHAVTWIE